MLVRIGVSHPHSETIQAVERRAARKTKSRSALADRLVEHDFRSVKLAAISLAASP
jgi:hypothetical protein